MASISNDPILQTGSNSGQSFFDLLCADITHTKKGQLTKKQKKQKALLEKIEGDFKRENEKIEEKNALEKYNADQAEKKKTHLENLAYWKSPQGQAQKKLNAISQAKINTWLGHPELNTGEATDEQAKRYEEQVKTVLNTARKYNHEPETKKIVIRKASELQAIEQAFLIDGNSKNIKELLKIIQS